jgi:hypothetical protein
VTELQTIGGLLLDLESRNGIDDISDTMVAEVQLELMKRVKSQEAE